MWVYMYISSDRQTSLILSSSIDAFISILRRSDGVAPCVSRGAVGRVSFILLARVGKRRARAASGARRRRRRRMGGTCDGCVVALLRSSSVWPRKTRGAIECAAQQPARPCPPLGFACEFPPLCLGPGDSPFRAGEKEPRPRYTPQLPLCLGRVFASAPHAPGAGAGAGPGEEQTHPCKGTSQPAFYAHIVSIFSPILVCNYSWPSSRHSAATAPSSTLCYYHCCISSRFIARSWEFCGLIAPDPMPGTAHPRCIEARAICPALTATKLWQCGSPILVQPLKRIVLCYSPGVYIYKNTILFKKKYLKKEHKFLSSFPCADVSSSIPQ